MSTPPEPSLQSAEHQVAIPDDLKRIRGITAATASALNALNVSTFAEIEAWSQADIRRVSDALQLGRRISRENWIEQAAMLARRRPISMEPPRTPVEHVPPIAPIEPPTSQEPNIEAVVDFDLHYSGEKSAALPTSADKVDAAASSDETGQTETIPPISSLEISDDIQDGSCVEPVSELSVDPMPSQWDDLANIRGLTPDMLERLGSRGVTRVRQIMDWTSDDLALMSVYLGPAARLNRDQWIEQASILAANKPTRHALRRASGEFQALASTAPDNSIWHIQPPSVTVTPTAMTTPNAEVEHIERAQANEAAAQDPNASATSQTNAPEIAPKSDQGAEAIVLADAQISKEQADFDAEATAIITRTRAIQERLGHQLERLQRDIDMMRNVSRADVASPSSSPHGQIQPSNAPPPHVDAQRAVGPAETPARISSHRQDNQDNDVTRDEPVAHAGEAEVRIVVRAAADTANTDRQSKQHQVHADPTLVPPLVRRPTVNISPRRLIERLRRVRGGNTAQTDAAPRTYRSSIEEASVEIVHHSDGEANDTASSKAGTPRPPRTSDSET